MAQKFVAGELYSLDYSPNGEGFWIIWNGPKPPIPGKNVLEVCGSVRRLVAEAHKQGAKLLLSDGAKIVLELEQHSCHAWPLSEKEKTAIYNPD